MCHRLFLNKITKVVSIITKEGIDMSKGYIVGDIHMCEKMGLEKFIIFNFCPKSQFLVFEEAIFTDLVY